MKNIQRNSIHLFLFMVALILLSFVPLSAEEKEPPEGEQEEVKEAPEIKLEKMVVTGSREEVEAPEKLPVPVQIITKEDIEAIGAINFADIVEMMQSVELVTSPDQNISPGFQTLRIRGMDIAHTLILVDGRRLPGAYPTASGYTYTDISTINVDMIERIDVLRDGASAQYGADAVAGVINIITKKYVEGFSLNSQYGSSSRDDGRQKHVDGSTGFPLGQFYVSMGGFYNDVGHYDRTEDIRWDSADYDQKGGNGKTVFDISDRQFLALDLRYIETDSKFRKDEVAYRLTDKTLVDTALSWEGGFDRWSFYLGSYLGTQDLNRRKSEDSEYMGDIDTENQQHDANAHWKATSWLSLFAGISWREESIDSDQRDFSETRRLRAYFVEATLRPFEPFKIQLSGRSEVYSDFGENFAPKIAARYEIISSLSVRASFSKSYQVPTLYQLHDMYLGAMGWLDIYGNPDLDAAKGRNITAGAVWKIAEKYNTTIILDYYNNQIEDMITTKWVKLATATENAEAKYINLAGTSTFEGYEANLSTDLLYGFGFEIMGNYLKARDPDDYDLKNRPRSGLVAILRYRYRDRLWGNLRYNYRGKYISDLNEKIEYFDTINAQLNFAITDNIIFYVGGRNILDEEVPFDKEKYQRGHIQGAIDSTIGAFWYGGLRFKF